MLRRRTRGRPGAIILLAAAALGCDEVGPAPDLSPESVLTQVIDRTNTLDLSEAWRIGGDPESGVQLYLMSDVARAEDGRFFVVDGGNDRILTLSPEGDVIGQFGREGEGPGEFQRPTTVVVRNDTVVVSGRSDRVHFFRSDGTVLATHRITVSDPEFRFGGGIGTDPGGWTAATNAYFRGGPGNETELPPLTRVHLHGLDPETGDLAPAAFRWAREEVGKWSGVFWITAPFAHGAVLDFDGLGRVIVADTASYRIDIFGSDGQLVTRMEGDSPPVPIDQAMLDSWLDARGCRPGQPECSDQRTNLAMTLPSPENIPPIRRIRAYGTGHFSVSRRDVDPDLFDDEEIPEYDYFAPDGSFLGSTSGIIPLWFDGEVLASLERDDLGVESLVMYRLR